MAVSCWSVTLQELLCPVLQVVTRTSDVRGAATDAAVFVELIGAGGASSGRQPLAPSGPQAFELGSIDEFKLLCEGLGELVQLRVGHDGSGAHPAWHLLQVRRSLQQLDR